MRIEVNLLPGAKRGRRKAAGGSIDFKKLGEQIAAKFKDFYLSLAIGAGIVALVVIGLLFMTQRSKAATLWTVCAEPRRLHESPCSFAAE